MNIVLYPENLIAYLYELEQSGCEIFTTSTTDATMWIIKQSGAGDWYTLIEWYEGANDYNTVNLCGKAIKRLKLLFKEYDQVS